MPRPRRADAARLLRAVAGCAAIYALFMFPWPGLGPAYAAAYRAAVSAGVACVDREASVRVLPFQPRRERPGAAMDTALVLERRAPDGSVLARARSFRSSRHTGWMPLALFAALVLATPVPWRRRGLALGLGLPLVSLFATAMPVFQVLDWLAQADPSLWPSESTAGAAARAAAAALARISTWMEPYAVVPALLWLVLCLRARDLASLRTLREPGPGPG